MNQISQAILRTLVYADIFDYPLTEVQIHKFLISELRITSASWRNELRKKLNEPFVEIRRKAPFYFLKGREKIIRIRKKREKWSQKKLKIATKVARWLKLIPTIKMVAVTGALAMKNSDKNDDIDLLVVTARNRLWLTRLLTVFLVELVARRRRPKDENVCDKICLNMFLDENHLTVPKKEQDLFAAHEVCQLKPLWYKDNCYQKFIKANSWSKKFLANWRP